MSSRSDASHPHQGYHWTGSDGLRIIDRDLPVEIPVGISLNGKPHTVLMSTPKDLIDLARGFVVTEAIAQPSDITGISSTVTSSGYLLDVRFIPTQQSRRARPRTLEGRSSCGLCGVQRLEDVVRPLPVVSSTQTFTATAIQTALKALDSYQPLGRQTRATHAAALADAAGALKLVREDVGRHNALDKLAGAALSAGYDAGHHFVLVTSRCSFEMVEKAARLGAPMIVAISAPTDLAVQRAEQAGLTLVALARADGHTIFSRADRLGLPAREFESV
jgi:FdhD protein